MERRYALVPAALGALAVLLLTVVGGASFPGYSHASQFISELGARGAPHAGIVNFAGFLPAGVCLCTFALLAWKSLPRSTATTLGVAWLALFAAGYVAAAFFPCEPGCRPGAPSLSQTVHEAVGLAGYLTAPPGLGLLAWSARGWPAARSLSVLGFAAAGITLLCLLLLSPDFPLVGVAQRALEGSVWAWVLACAVYISAVRPELPAGA